MAIPGILFTLCIALALCLAIQPGMAWAQALTASAEADNVNKALSGWSGWWANELPQSVEFASNPAPLKAEIRQVLDDRANMIADPLRFCRPQQFAGHTGHFAAAIEFLFTAGRITITGEDGLVRRIYLTETAPPDTVEPGNMGFSTGRWEAQTLVVETSHISPQVRYPDSVQGFPIGNGVHIVERISLRDAETLQIEVTVVAPEILARPDTRVHVYKRLNKTVANEISFCVDADRSFDASTGLERFDLTPPLDLPPPPPR